MAIPKSSILSLPGGWEKSETITDVFKKHFFRYMLIREGYVSTVYRDHKGLLTVGVGHLVTPADNLSEGAAISFQKGMNFFESDFLRLRIPYVSSRAAWWKVPQRLAVGSFVWCHGYGEYLGGETEKLLMNHLTTQSQARAWVKKNWDLTSPQNQTRNNYDLDLFFTGKSLSPSGNFYWDGKDSYYIAPLNSGLAHGVIILCVLALLTVLFIYYG